MMKKAILYKTLQMSIIALAVLTSCKKENIDKAQEVVSGSKLFNISANFDNVDSETYIAPTMSLVDGKLTFKSNGLKLNSVRSARVMANSDNVYNFDYGGGILYQYKNNVDGKTYDLIKEIDISLTMGGATYVRPTMINDRTILFHNIVREN